jgi:hypothetical protein
VSWLTERARRESIGSNPSGSYGHSVRSGSIGERTSATSGSSGYGSLRRPATTSGYGRVSGAGSLNSSGSGDLSIWKLEHQTRHQEW